MHAEHFSNLTDAELREVAFDYLDEPACYRDAAKTELERRSKAASATASKNGAAIRRDLSNLRGVVRRKNVTGFCDRSARVQYERAALSLVKLEDAVGVDAAAPYADRLTALRNEAISAGLLTYGEVLDADRRACVSSETTR